MFTAQAMGAKVVKVPLTKPYAHDVKAMLAAAPDAGVFYVCSPNNPTGTLTSHSDIEYLVENKPKGSVVLVDEAYIHFSDAVSVMDLVRAGKDVILLRTFSQLYGIADLCPHHGRNRARDGTVPGRMAEGNVRRSDGQCGRDSGLGRTGPAQEEWG